MSVTRSDGCVSVVFVLNAPYVRMMWFRNLRELTLFRNRFRFLPIFDHAESNDMRSRLWRHKIINARKKEKRRNRWGGFGRIDE